MQSWYVALSLCAGLGTMTSGCQKARAWLVGFVEFSGDADAQTPDQITLASDNPGKSTLKLSKIT